jgi:hypothetical protein
MQPGGIRTIQELAEAVRARRLTVPAIFILELCKPLTGCLRELYGVSLALQNLICGRELVPALQEVLESSDAVEQLITLLEQPVGGVSLQGNS